MIVLLLILLMGGIAAPLCSIWACEFPAVAFHVLSLSRCKCNQVKMLAIKRFFTLTSLAFLTFELIACLLLATIPR